MAWHDEYYNYNYNYDDSAQFTVYINEGEKYQIEEWVKRHPNIETGGDLFGAWIDDRNAVVQFVLGPGEGCRRTSVSFYQDIDYLREAGSYLTKNHGLCNIGQWHSHHTLGLTRPSGGDENTVWGNMPNLGLDRYIVFIATIRYNSGYYYNDKGVTVNINPYLFEIKNGRRSRVMQGSFKYMENNSPFRLDKVIQQGVIYRAESTNRIKRYIEVREENKDRKRRRNETGNESTQPENKQPKSKEKEEGM